MDSSAGRRRRFRPAHKAESRSCAAEPWSSGRWSAAGAGGVTRPHRTHLPEDDYLYQTFSNDRRQERTGQGNNDVTRRYDHSDQQNAGRTRTRQDRPHRAHRPRRSARRVAGRRGWWAYQSGTLSSLLAPTSQPAALVAAPVAANATPVQGTAAEAVREGSAASAASVVSVASGASAQVSLQLTGGSGRRTGHPPCHRQRCGRPASWRRRRRPGWLDPGAVLTAQGRAADGAWLAVDTPPAPAGCRRPRCSPTGCTSCRRWKCRRR